MRKFPVFVSMRMDQELADQVSQAADKAGVSVSKWIRQAAAERIEREKASIE